MNEQLQVRLGFTSESGRRAENQDFVAASLADHRHRALQGLVAAVADGIGGGQGGRQAAEVTVRGFLEAYYSLPETLGVERAACRALGAMNRWVFSQGRQDPQLAHMGTTFSALLLRARQAHVVHVGDTRIYRLRAGRLELLTEDHTLRSPDLRHVLYRAVGLESELRADHAVHSLNLHDRFLLCSDGVHGVLPARRVHELLMHYADPEIDAGRIVAAALDAGSQDNVTALVLDVVGLPAPDQSLLAEAMEALPIPELPKVGEEVDGFWLEQRLSEGRYSCLFIAEDRGERRKVVLKFPHPRITTDAACRDAFVREAWVAARVHSPWVGEVLDLPPGRKTRLYSVHPYYLGDTLEHRLVRPPKVRLEEGVEIGVRLAKAVHALNRARIIHRDIKPDNVILLNDGGLKLVDLGVARLPGVVQDEADIPGTPSYMAPELFAGEPGDERSEVYALGVTLYRMFSAGHYPFGEVEPFSHPRFVRRIPLGRHRPDLPAWLDDVLARATAPDPDRRLKDAMELAFELEMGLAQGGKSPPPKPPLYHRNPLLVWQMVSLGLLLALLASLAR